MDREVASEPSGTEAGNSPDSCYRFELHNVGESNEERMVEEFVTRRRFRRRQKQRKRALEGEMTLGFQNGYR